MTKRNALKAAMGTPRKSKIEALGAPLTVRGKLALLGWPSLDAWSVAHGYQRKMCSYVIRHWANRSDKHPHGGIARAVMIDLRATLAQGLGPQDRQTQEP
jgi:hypothetical protein